MEDERGEEGRVGMEEERRGERGKKEREREGRRDG